MFELKGARQLCHDLLRGFVQKGDLVVDATAGNGHDTAFLAQLVGDAGIVHAFDVQEQAIENTKQRLLQAGLSPRVNLHLCSHADMDVYVKDAPALVLFNLGWLPGGKHEKTTRLDSTLEAVSKALLLLAPGGIVAICIYPGHAEGERERQALLAMAKGLRPQEFNCIYVDFPNQRADAPKVLMIQKNKDAS